MLVKYIDIAEASGKLGGMVAARNRGGQYLRQWRSPVNPSTEYQESVRQGLAAASAAWTSVNQSVRDAWANYAAGQQGKNRISQSLSLTGQNLYVGSLSFRHQVDGNYADFVEVVPTQVYKTVVTPITGSFTAATGTISLIYAPTDEWAVKDGGVLAVYFGRVRPRTQVFFKGPYNFIGGVAGNTLTPPTSPFTSILSGNFVVGQRITVRVRAIAPDNRISTSQVLQLIAG